MRKNSTVKGNTRMRRGHLEVFSGHTKPSGTKIAIFELPTVEVPAMPFKFARVSVPGGANTDPDTHEVREIWLIAQGEARVTIAGNEITVRAGDVLYFDSNQTHQLFNDSGESVEFFAVWWRPRGYTPD